MEFQKMTADDITGLQTISDYNKRDRVHRVEWAIDNDQMNKFVQIMFADAFTKRKSSNPDAPVTSNGR